MITIAMQHVWIIYLLIGLLALTVGSFLNVLIHRFPIMMERAFEREYLESKGEALPDEPAFNLAFPASHCPFCNLPLKFWHNIPLLSYLFLGGRCAYCKTPISIRYLLVELLTALLSLIALWVLGLTALGFSAVLFTWYMIPITFIDIEHQYLPDELSLSLLWIGLLLNCFSVFTTPVNAIIGAAAGYVFFWLIAKLFYLLTKKEGLGQGDFKLLAAFGAWMGFKMLPLIILASCILTLVIAGIILLFKRKSKDTPVPYGPFLAAAAWSALLWGPIVMNWYFHISGIA